MKRLSGFVVITILVLGFSSAMAHAAPSGPLQFDLMDFEGNPFCDFLEFSYGTSLAAGVDVQSPCLTGLPDGTLMGVVSTVPGGSMLPVTGSVVMLADNAADAFGYYEGVQIVLLVKTSTSLTKYGWEELFNLADDPVVYFADYGYLLKHNGPIVPGPLAKGQTMKRLGDVSGYTHQATSK